MTPPLVLCIGCGRLHRDPFWLGAAKNSLVTGCSFPCPCGRRLTVPTTSYDASGRVTYSGKPGDAPLFVRALREAAASIESTGSLSKAREMLRELSTNAAIPVPARTVAKATLALIDAYEKKGTVFNSTTIAALLTLFCFTYCGSSPEDQSAIEKPGIYIEHVDDLHVNGVSIDDLRAWFRKTPPEESGETGGR